MAELLTAPLRVPQSTDLTFTAKSMSQLQKLFSLLPHTETW